jgi:hypothetical protein
MTATHQDPVFNDVAELEQTLTDDASGDRARSMMGYFEEAARAGEALASGAKPEQQQFAADLVEGLRASKRIVRHVWESLHQAALPA